MPSSGEGGLEVFRINRPQRRALCWFGLLFVFVYIILESYLAFMLPETHLEAPPTGFVCPRLDLLPIVNFTENPRIYD